MNWYARQRQAFIGEMLTIYGFINRAHLMRKFGCSNILASNDLTAFAAEHPDKVRYDNRQKSYVAPGVRQSPARSRPIQAAAPPPPEPSL